MNNAMPSRLSSADLARLKKYLIETVSRSLESIEIDPIQKKGVVRERLNALLEQMRVPLPADVRKELIEVVLNDVVGYGPIQPLLDDDEISEIMVNGPKKVYVEKKGQIQHTNVVFDDLDGRGAVTIRDLVRNALRMRPDRIVVGECRGGEALDMLQAMNTGHDGSMTTIHANSPRDALARLETLVLMAGIDLPLKVVRQQISSAVDLIVQQSRLRDGTRKITSISEVVGMEGDVITMSELFKFEQTGITPDGKVIGTHKATGLRPLFYSRLEAAGYKLDASVFGVGSSSPSRR